MNALGQVCLLVAFVGSGYGAFACVAGRGPGRRRIGRSGDWAAVAGVVALSVAITVLARALLLKDFRFAYVAEYSSRLLPWHYSLSALWVGQAGSLLMWAWLVGMLAVVYRFWPRARPSELRQHAFGVMMAYLCFLVAVMVFGADPMDPSVGTPREGVGLSPLLQHPVMLIHPPIVFLGYAGWVVPFALTIAALACGRLDAEWVHEARRWALFAWAVLGGGILLGALWAYEELGWGGYWSWDPVENGSLIPWLTGTALVHTLMAWQYTGAFRKTTLSLAIATFALCNFATFLTRSGVFSSLHAFGESPIGWMFLAFVAMLAIGGGGLIVARRSMLGANRRFSSVWAREAFVLIGVIAILLLAAVALLGTLAAPLSNLLLGRSIVFGPAFYNNVLIPTGLLLLAATAAAPMLRWGNAPTVWRRRTLYLCAGGGVLAVVVAFLCGVRRPIALAVTWSAALAGLAAAGSLMLDARPGKGTVPFFLRENRDSPRVMLRPPLGSGLLRTLRVARRQYAGFLIHLGFVCLAVGVAGSSLGTHRREVVMHEGQTLEWAGRSIRFVRLVQREQPDKLVAEAKLEVTPRGAAVTDTLLPAQHLYHRQQEWTTEVAVHSTWGGDLYTILRGGEEDGRVNLTLVENPLMRFLWLGGCVMGAGALLGLWPAGRRATRPSPEVSASTSSTADMPRGPVPAPHRKRRTAQHNVANG